MSTTAVLTLHPEHYDDVEGPGGVLPGTDVLPGVLRRDARDLQHALRDHVVSRKWRPPAGPRDARRWVT